MGILQQDTWLALHTTVLFIISSTVRGDPSYLMTQKRILRRGAGAEE